MEGKNRIKIIVASFGAIVVGLLIVLIVLLSNGSVEERPMEVSVPDEEFIYRTDEEYGGNLKFSTEIENLIFYDLSGRARDEIIKRISAWFAINYPEYNTFGLVKDSYKKEESEAKNKVSARLVSDIGTVVGLEITDEIENDFVTKTTVRILTSSGEEAYKTEINWEEI